MKGQSRNSQGRLPIRSVSVRKKWVATVLLVLLSSLSVVYKAGGETTTLYVDPQSTKIWGTGETFSVDIKVAQVTGLYGWQITLYYKRQVLNGTEIIEGSFLESEGETYFNFTLDNEYNNTYGRVTAYNSLIGNVSAVNGTGILLTITFKAKNIGNSLLDVEETILGDRNGNPIPCTVMDGTVQVVPLVHDVAIESLIPTPDRVVDGQIVDIHVIAGNRGNLTESFNVTAYYNQTVIDKTAVEDLAPGKTVALTFVWNTTGVTPNATYVVKAEASPVRLETILGNNVRQDKVDFVAGIHEIIVNSVYSSSQSAYKGSVVHIYVAVKNQGNYTERFNLTLFRNDTTIETKTVQLKYGTTEYIIFSWNTTDAEANATYRLKAAASWVEDEEDYQNNNCTDGYITVYPAGVIDIQIVELYPCDEAGNTVDSFMAGSTAYFKITVQSTSIEAEEVLLTVNLYDSQGGTIGVISFKGPIGSETTTFMPGFPIPQTVSSGTATAYVNILTDWPHTGGVPYCPEEYTTFEVVAS